MASELLTDLPVLTTVNPTTLFYGVDGGTSYQFNLNTVGAGITGIIAGVSITGVSITGGIGIQGALNINAGTNVTLTQAGLHSFSINSSAAAGGGGAVFTGLSSTGMIVGQSGSITLDFYSGVYQNMIITGNTTFSTLHREIGKSLVVRTYLTGSSQRAMNFAAWNWLGTDYSTGIMLNTGKYSVLSLTAFGSNESDIMSVLSLQP